MSFIDVSDWKALWCKLKWQFISFKFLAFWIYTILLVFFFYFIEHIHKYTCVLAENLFNKKVIDSKQVVEIINHSQTVLWDTALSHLLLFLGTILTGIIAIKGVSYITESKNKQTVINKLDSSNTEDLKQFLPKKGS